MLAFLLLVETGILDGDRYGVSFFAYFVSFIGVGGSGIAGGGPELEMRLCELTCLSPVPFGC